METQTNIENITFNQLSEELTAIKKKIDLTEQNIEATQTKLDETEKQIEMIEEERIEELRSQIDAARKTLADKKLVLKERQQLLQSRQEYLHSMEEVKQEQPVIASLDNTLSFQILKELQQNISHKKLELTDNDYLDEDSFEAVLATVKKQTITDKLFAKEFAAYFGKILSAEQKTILQDIQPNFSQ